MTAAVERGPGDRPEIALTFDDGPGGATAAVLRALDGAAARGTFFMVGGQVREHPEQARAVAAAGHEIGSHTYEHLDHEAVPAETALEDMLDGAAAIERVLGFEPPLYRAPYGHFVPSTSRAAALRGWTCVGWTMLAGDWRAGETGESIADRVVSALEPGAILVLHDGRRDKPADHAPMLAALPAILQAAAERGLQPVTVSELLPS